VLIILGDHYDGDLPVESIVLIIYKYYNNTFIINK
jgi:hypothetical protein